MGTWTLDLKPYILYIPTYPYVPLGPNYLVLGPFGYPEPSKQELFGGRERVSAALDAACGLSHLHNMTPRRPELGKGFRVGLNFVSSQGFKA